MTLPLWLDSAIQHYGYWIVLLAVGLESMGVPFPGETTLVAAAVYAGTSGRLNIAGVILAAAFGAILGDNLGYTIGRRGGYPLVRRFSHILRLNEEHLARAQRYFARHGDKTVFVGRFFTLLRTWAAFLAGVNRMHWRTFVFWNAAGGITWALAYGALGFALGNNLPLLERILRIIGVGGAVALGLVVASATGYWWWRRHRQRLPATLSATSETATGPESERAPTRRRFAQRLRGFQHGMSDGGMPGALHGVTGRARLMLRRLAARQR
jgi:membrane protein DedA with SNARE-associated domain